MTLLWPGLYWVNKSPASVALKGSGINYSEMNLELFFQNLLSMLSENSYSSSNLLSKCTGFPLFNLSGISPEFLESPRDAAIEVGFLSSQRILVTLFYK